MCVVKKNMNEASKAMVLRKDSESSQELKVINNKKFEGRWNGDMRKGRQETNTLKKIILGKGCLR